MKWLSDSLLIALGASFGANGRYWLTRWIQTRTDTPFPWGTFWVNLSGCFGIGLFLGLLVGLNWAPQWRALVVVGFLGGYTTFSAFSLETYNLIQRGSFAYAFGNVFGSVLLGLVGTWIGDLIARLLLGTKS